MTKRVKGTQKEEKFVGERVIEQSIRWSLGQIERHRASRQPTGEGQLEDG